MTNGHIEEVAVGMINVEKELWRVSNIEPVDHERLEQLSEIKWRLLLSVWRITTNGRYLHELFANFPEVIQICEDVTNKLREALKKDEDDDL